MGDYRPAFSKQLNGNGATPVPGKTDGAMDCGPRAAQHGIRYLTRGEVSPAIREIRKRGNVPGPQLTNIYDLQRAVESYTPRGRTPLRLFIKDHVGDIKGAVNAGKAALICIDYGTFNRLAAKTGDPNYMKGHSVMVTDERQYEGEVEWLLYDSLDDARRKGIAGPGPRWVDRSILVRSMEAFAKADGRCYAGVFGGGQKR